MQIQLRIHELYQMVEREQLAAHPGLIAQEVALHALHEFREGPEGDGIVLHDRIDGREQVGHALHIAEGGVVFVVGEEHVFHLLEVNVGAGFGEGGVRVGVRCVFAGEEGDVAIGAVNVLFCGGC
jgi:hypothetical protein